MNTSKLLVDKTRLLFLVEGRKCVTGVTTYFVTCKGGRFHFNSLDSVIDFINSNDFGYVE